MNGFEIIRNYDKLGSGIKVLKNFLINAPTLPGIYIFFDKNHKPIYVGKAKNIKNRVSNYTLIEPNDYKKNGILEKISSIECKVCENELDALLLEASQIKLLQPRYNVLLKDGKTFPEICITKSTAYPAIVYHKGKRLDNGNEYFGPFAKVNDVKNVLTFLRKTFKTRNCSDWDFKSRKRPCLEYQIKRCTAPCVNLISKEDYNFNVKCAKEVLLGKYQQVKDDLIQKMNHLSESMDYEKAAQVRDIIKSLAIINIQEKTGVYLPGDWDVFGTAYQNGVFTIEVVLIRNGNYHGSKSFNFEDKEEKEYDSILADFILQFYSYYKPENILIGKQIEDINLIEQALQVKFQKKIVIQVANNRSNKLKVIEFANNNAKQSLLLYFSKINRNRANLNQLRDKLKISYSIQYIEAFDNSHLFGDSSVGVSVAIGENGFAKNLYRKYNFKNNYNGNDYGMMQEIITRRLQRIKKDIQELTDTNKITINNNDENFYSAFLHYLEDNSIQHSLPGLWIIDGGIGHLNSVKAIMRQNNLHIPFIGIAKGEHRDTDLEVILLADGAPADITKGDPLYYYLQTIRDEAHRFAISGYRSKHTKKNLSSSIDSIPGVGKLRKKLLLSHFGSLYNIQNASVDLLASVPGINKVTAQKIFDYLKSYSMKS